MTSLPQFALTFLGILFCIGDVAALGLLLTWQERAPSPDVRWRRLIRGVLPATKAADTDPLLPLAAGGDAGVVVGSLAVVGEADADSPLPPPPPPQACSSAMETSDEMRRSLFFMRFPEHLLWVMQRR